MERLQVLNKELETNINRERLLSNLAQNLNVDFINDGSTIKKMADTYYNEAIQFSSLVDTALNAGFLATMPESMLNAFGRQYNVQRKKYNNLNIYASQNVVSIKVDKSQAIVKELSSAVLINNRGDIIYSDANIAIQALEDIYISNINEEIYISVKLSLNSVSNYYNISEGSLFSSNQVDPNVKSIIPYTQISFKKPVGLSLLEETVADYRARLYEATYVANNGANSLLSSALKEVPFVYYLETEDYVKGRGIRNIYPYTDQLINTGMDGRLSTYVVPMLETNLQNKVIYGQLVNVIEPEPVYVQLTIDFSKFKSSLRPTESLLENIRLKFNQYFYREKSFDKSLLLGFIQSELSSYELTADDFYFIFSSPFVSEETFNLDRVNGQSISIPKGRFLHLASITIEEIPSLLPL